MPAPAAEMLSETSHLATIGGRAFAYRALAGDPALSDEAGKPKARMFYVAYLKKDVRGGEELRRRPTGWSEPEHSARRLRSCLRRSGVDRLQPSGAYDLVTTSLATRYVLDHLTIDPALRKNLTFAEYPSGHMMYMHEPSLALLKKDLAAFYASAMAR